VLIAIQQSLNARRKVMASKSLFNKNTPSRKAVPVANTVNVAGGKAYSLTDKHALAQFAVTGTFANQFYTTAEQQLAAVKELLNKVDPIFVAKLAVYARENALMKDMPAALLASLSTSNVELMKKIFDRVVDNGKMLRNFVQLVRSGEFGRKSFGNAPKKAIQRWIESRKDYALFNDSVGNEPSLADVIKMVHPHPSTAQKAALYGYICGKEVVPNKKDMKFRKIEGTGTEVAQTVNFQDLPEVVQAFENFKNGKTKETPNVSFQMLTALPLTNENWKDIARKAPFQMLRMNLNTFERHGVLKDDELVSVIAAKLRDAEAIEKAKVFPYQIMAAYSNIEDSIPTKIQNALHDALDIATKNVPSFEGKKVYVFPDVSGSMGNPATGNRGTATSKVRCIDIAALVSATVLRRNDDAVVMPFDDGLHSTSAISGRDSILTNAAKLAAFGGGGTSCELPLIELNKNKAKADILIYVSDNASWYGTGQYQGKATVAAAEWKELKKRNPNAKMVCINVQSDPTTQISDDNSVMNIGGFSDQIFETILNFVNNKGKNANVEAWVKEIEAVVL
jgi:60 kDa SS-A/Ro ribonucleoprotein